MRRGSHHIFVPKAQWHLLSVNHQARFDYQIHEVIPQQFFHPQFEKLRERIYRDEALGQRPRMFGDHLSAVDLGLHYCSMHQATKARPWCPPRFLGFQLRRRPRVHS